MAAATSNSTSGDSRLRASTPLSEQDDDSSGAPQPTGTPMVASRSSNGAQSTSPRVPTSNNGLDTDVDKAKRKRQPRNSACQSCAALKMKCIATSVPGICERCSRMNRECLPAIPKPRKRRATDGFEPKGIPLSDLLDRDTSSHTAYSPVQRPFVREHVNGSPPQHVQLHTERSDPSRSFLRSFSHGLAMDDKSSAYLLQGIDHNLARHCCEQFRFVAACFPFIEAPHVDPLSFVSTRPVTLAAICIVASGSQPDIRLRLSEAFRHALATRCIVEGERSVDLMVGLLIYTAWHHLYFQKQQLYQYLCLLAGMATDLGLQKTPSLAEQARGVPEPELQKAFVGVYYLVSSLSIMGFNKPSPLTWCQSIDHFASALYSSTGREINLQPYVDLAHLLEDHAALLAAAPMSNTASYIDLATKSSLARLRTLRSMHPPSSATSAFAAVSLYINARALSTLTSGPPGAVLMQTAMSLKDYLDDILLRPPITLHHLAIGDWTNLLVALLLATRLSSPSFLLSVSRVGGFGAGWESSTLAGMLSPDTVLDRIYNHTATAANDQHHGSRQEGFLSWLRGVCDSMKRRMQSERNEASEQPPPPFNSATHISRDSRPSNVGPGFGGHDEGRFRAVNADTKQHLPAAILSPWSPTAATDLGFAVLGGIALLDDGFWVTFSSGGPVR